MIKLKSLIREDETKFKDDWLSIKTTKVPGVKDKFTYMHEQGTKGKSVAVLLYRRTGKDGWQYGVRKEIVPAWSNSPTICALTGGMEDGDSLEERAIAEIKEESGYTVKKEDLEDLGTCFGAKSIDTTFYLYAAQIHDQEEKEPKGDGSTLEKKSDFEWTYFDHGDKNKIQDAILSTMILRLGFG